MLLPDDLENFEKSPGEETAANLAHTFEKTDEKWRHGLATKGDLEKGLLLTQFGLQAEITKTKIDVVRWVVGGFFAQSTLLVAVIVFLK